VTSRVSARSDATVGDANLVAAAIDYGNAVKK
jgi:hypothetical protein